MLSPFMFKELVTQLQNLSICDVGFVRHPSLDATDLEPPATHDDVELRMLCSNVSSYLDFNRIANRGQNERLAELYFAVCIFRPTSCINSQFETQCKMYLRISIFHIIFYITISLLKV